jgi:hypothetical protein
MFDLSAFEEIPPYPSMRLSRQKPVQGRIAQVYSQSDDPNAASLLSIAPELRNHIYEYLLVDDKPITIASGDAGCQIVDFIGSAAIIRACRQIYHEAVGVLYGQNIFQFKHGVGIFFHMAVGITCPVDTFSQWTRNIGSCLSNLRNVTINMDMPDIPEKYQNHEIEEEFNDSFESGITMLPLLKSQWDGVTRNLSVRFESSENDLSSSWDVTPNHSNCNVRLLNQALDELATKGSLDLKSARHFLQKVNIDPTGTRGTITYRSTRYHADFSREFRLSKDTQGYEFDPLPRLSSPVHLPPTVLHTVVRLSRNTQEVTYDFDACITHGADFAMLNVSKQFRRAVGPYCLLDSRFVIILGSGSAYPQKAIYEKLEHRLKVHWEDSKSFSSISLGSITPVEAAYDYGNVPTIVLQFQSTDHIHINAWDLVQATSTFPPNTTISIRIRGRDDYLHSTTLGEIRKYALTLIEYLDANPTPDTHNSVVEVELDEQFLPARAIFKKEGLGQQRAGVDVVNTVEKVDITLLHNMVRVRAWVPPRRLCCFWWQIPPIAFDDKTIHGLMEQLRYLCEGVYDE